MGDTLWPSPASCAGRNRSLVDFGRNPEVSFLGELHQETSGQGRQA